MALRRVIYAILLVAAVAAFIVTDSAIALFLMICMLIFPPASFVMLFIAKRRLKFDFSTRESCIRGGAIQLDMQAQVTPRLLIGCVNVTADIENSTFDKTVRKSFTFSDLAYNKHTYEYVSSDSGRICVKIKNIKLIDIFGIFSVNVACSKFAESFVSPVIYDDIQVSVGMFGDTLQSGEMSVPTKGNDRTEIFDIRDYAAGDSLKAVHWKLSSKFDSLKTKEYGSTYGHKTLVLVDLSRTKNDVEATDEQLNGVLDVAVSISDSLKSSGYAHSVGWFNDGVFSCAEVGNSNSFVNMVDKLMSIKVKDGNADAIFYLARSVECAPFTKIILVAAAVDYDDIKNYSGAKITALAVGNENAFADEHGISIINIPCNNVRAALADCVL